jgi:glucose-1-phosphate thymidylyltransferase
MKIIVPMAGRGSRLRPHTLTVPKPLIPVAGKSIVHRLVEDIAKILKEPIEEVAFILGDPAFFGDDLVESLEELAGSLGAKASFTFRNRSCYYVCQRIFIRSGSYRLRGYIDTS